MIEPEDPGAVQLRRLLRLLRAARALTRTKAWALVTPCPEVLDLEAAVDRITDPPETL